MSKLIKEIRKRLKKQSKVLVKDKTLTDLPALSSMLNLEKGAKLLIKSLEKGERTLIVGDYDADGIMATTILYGFLRDIGFTQDIVDFIIPSRLKDGYGLSQNIIDYALENDFDTIVTVDNGIAAVDAIKSAKESGLIVIVTDHHTAPPVLPNADVIINPKQPGETFPFINISGATVAWYFACQIKELLGLKIDMRKYLDLAGITVISDVMPLNDINLAIYNFTLKKLKSRTRYVYELVWDEWTAPCINETSIGFSLVPMINAIGRIADANLGVELFLSRDKNFINKTFDEIKEINNERKIRTQAYKNNAISMLHADFDSQQQVVIVRNKSYHEGIVGIIAGKLAELYKKPAFVFSWSEDKKVWKGSGRSVGNVHLYDLTNKAKETILGFGGHKGAVGLAVKDDVFEKFKDTLEKAALTIPAEKFEDSSLTPFECSLDDINMEVLNTLDEYAPFGEGNKLPMFKADNVTVAPEREFSGGLHFQTYVTSKTGTKMKAMFFHIRDRDEFLEKISKGTVNILFTINKKYNARNDIFSFEIYCQLEE